MPHHIEHPASIGAHNKAVLDTLTDAYQVALQLASEGHQITAICSGRGQPIVWIRASELTLKLDSCAPKTSCDPRRGRYEIRSTVRNGVAINWIVRRSTQRRAA